MMVLPSNDDNYRPLIVVIKLLILNFIKFNSLNYKRKVYEGYEGLFNVYEINTDLLKQCELGNKITYKR
jgi:hypothetical protein